MSATKLSVGELFSLQGKTVICTGATGGIGQEMCITLAEAGAEIVSIQVSDDPHAQVLSHRLESLGKSFRAFECDLRDASAMRQTFQVIWDAGVMPDILLNCAGVNRRGPIAQVTDEDLDLILSINLKATYIASQEFSKRLLELQRPGKIINIGSVTSYRGMYNVSAYASSKGGVIQLTKAFSNEFARQGIQVNCICPGYIKTALTTQLENDPEYNDFIIRGTPAGRWGTPDDLRGAVTFLASPASDFVTGTGVVVDGGMLGA
ncbi:SDR family NAD(P)-dependent oxidoreductase [Aspergillus glaucus CBS 516.65]|uniref:2-deoxy-D-gluconate 3-dehydrogenase n=1 Tax=Aspergillus glaucus CBS 516.65 TaxID=1160497 RepID=A0A1L9VCV6_ASPGL|nr:hypothetical protein ASPGLDRAFT_59784 [Aspergillus glaucus CBS 516.65]OJJ81744.1 hypothetical protein ASPGLDRAFT_59784 [Aspergillus glaucus CBS 516.65]